MKETRMQKEKRMHRELMNNIIEVRQYDYTEGYKITVKYASGATRTYRNEPSWFMEYIEDSWSIMQETFNVYGSYEQIHNNYKPIELSTPEEVEEVQAVEEVTIQSIDVEVSRDEHYATGTKETKAVFHITYTDGSAENIETMSNTADYTIPNNEIAMFLHTADRKTTSNCYWYVETMYTANENTVKVVKPEVPAESEEVQEITSADTSINSESIPGEKLYITVYDGDRSGIGRITKTDKNGSAACWQENRKYKDYIPECMKAGFTSVTPKYGMLICEL